MGLVAYLAELADVAVERVGALELVASKDVDAFLQAVKRRRAVVIGIEGFRIRGNQVIPDMNAIADFSDELLDSETSAATIEMASRFLHEVAAPDVYFDFVLEDLVQE
jgi:hypothetical protein